MKDPLCPGGWGRERQETEDSLPVRPGAAGGRPGMPEPAGFIWIPQGSKLGVLRKHQIRSSPWGARSRMCVTRMVLSYITVCPQGLAQGQLHTRGLLLKEEINLALPIIEELQFYIHFLLKKLKASTMIPFLLQSFCTYGSFCLACFSLCFLQGQHLFLPLQPSTLTISFMVLIIRNPSP